MLLTIFDPEHYNLKTLKKTVKHELEEELLKRIHPLQLEIENNPQNFNELTSFKIYLHNLRFESGGYENIYRN